MQDVIEHCGTTLNDVNMDITTIDRTPRVQP